MALLKIQKLNKMTCGNRRGLIDMTVQIRDIIPDIYLLPGTEVSLLSSCPSSQRNAGIATESNVDYEYARTDAIYDYYRAGQKHQLVQETNNKLVLNEHQTSIDIDTYNDQISATGGLSGSSAIQLTPEFWILSAKSDDEIDEFNEKLSSIRVIYEFELCSMANTKPLLSALGSNSQFLPLNDLLDLCIKSLFKKSVANYAIPGNLMLKQNQMTHSKNVDQYFVFEDNPISFCQFQNDAFAISQPMTSQPYRMKSNLQDQVQSGQMNEAHQFQLVQDDIETVLYHDVDYYNTETYADYLREERSNIEQQSILDMFTPARSIKGIDYNYIVQIEQNVNPNIQFDNPTIYDNGDVFGFFTVGKNMYNALYSMEMSNSNEMQNCREYAGIQDMGDKLMLKYYDSCDYEIDDSSHARLLSTSSSSSNLYPYQKIETFAPNEFSYATMHKSNLFSIKISNTGLDDESLRTCSDQQKHIAEMMKKSISNAMKQLANSIAPANTQLFATYFVNYS